MRTTSRWLLVMLGLVAAISLLVAACGDDDDDSSNDDEEPTAEETSDTDEEDGDEEPEDTPDGAGDDDDDEDGPSRDLDELAEAYNDFRGKVTYEVTGFGGDEGISTMTVYRSDNASRFDVGGGAGTTTIIQTEEEVFVCAAGSCLRYANDGLVDANPFALVTGFVDAERIAEDLGGLPDDVEVEEFTDEVSGEDASCFRYSGDIDETSGADEGSYCFNDDGLLVRLQVTSGDELGSFEASEVSTEVSDSDFEPPFEVTDLEDLTG